MTDRIGVSYPSPATSFFMEADHIASDNVNGRWLVRFRLRAVNGPGGSTGSSYGGHGDQVGYYNGTEFGRHAGTPFLPSGVPNGGLRWNDGPWDVWVNGRNGWIMPLQQYLLYGSVAAWSYGEIPLPTLASVPAKPAAPKASNITANSMRLSWTIPSNGGSPIDQMLLRRSLKSDLSAPYTDYPLGAGATSHDVTGLAPQTTYYWGVYARNAVGYSPRSNVTTQATVPSGPPGVVVTPLLSGTGARIAMSPPGGVSGVTRYRFQRRLLGGATDYDKTVDAIDENPFVMPQNAEPPLTPGATYQYRAYAIIGAYTSPWSNWVSATQPNPNTDPGSYFDGDTPASGALTYAWAGTPGKSTSYASGLFPTGWREFPAAALTSGGTGVVFRAAGGHQGSFSARAVFFTDATAYGFQFGTSGTANAHLAAVERNNDYFGSIYATPSKAKNVRAVIRWHDVDRVVVGTSPGEYQVVAANTETRLVASGTAPGTAVWASVIVEDAAAEGTTMYRGGDWLQLDAAMVSLRALFPYFDGSTPDGNGFIYDWLGTANASASIRTPAAPDAAETIVDPDCPPIPGAPQPPAIDEECIDEVGTWRRYWAVIPESEVYDWLTVVPTTRITTAGVAARQVRVRYYPNPDELAPEDALNLDFESEQIITYMPANSVFTLDGVSESAWGSVAGRAEIPVDHLLRGSAGTPPEWPVLSCGGSYLISFDVPLDAPEGNISLGVSLTTRMT